jgi:hypothetical protein
MSQSIEDIFLESARKLFRHYKKLGEGAMAQLNDEQVLVKPNEASNSIALIVHHLSGNMLSRWTDFLTSDGEKPWRNREAEFEDAYPDKKTMMEAWDKGWTCLLNSVDALTPADLPTIVYIRNEGQTALDAIQRQLAHYSNHVGQIIFQAKVLKGDAFQSLSIPKGKSEKINEEKFKLKKEVRHFTDRA